MVLFGSWTSFMQTLNKSATGIFENYLAMYSIWIFNNLRVGTQRFQWDDMHIQKRNSHNIMKNCIIFAARTWSRQFLFPQMLDAFRPSRFPPHSHVKAMPGFSAFFAPNKITGIVNRNTGNVAYMRQNPTYIHSQPTYCSRCYREIRYKYHIEIIRIKSV